MNTLQRTDERGTEEMKVNNTSWKLWDATNIDNWEGKPLEWLADPLIPKGTVGFMSGQPKLGKSLMALDLCLHISHAHLEATQWLGRFKCSPGNILYIAREDPDRRIKERGVEILESYGWDLVLPGALNFLIRERFNLLDDEHLDWLAEQVEKLKVNFLILDVFNRMIPDLDENSARDMAKAVDVIEKLNRDHDLTILMLDHTRKPAVGQNPLQPPNPFELRGSTAKYGCADFMICIGRTKQDGRLQVYCENKDTDQCPNFLVDVSPKGSTDPKFRWAGDVTQISSDRKAVGKANREKVLGAVGTNWMPSKEIRQKVGLSRSTVGDHLSALVGAELVEEKGDNRDRRYRRKKTDRPRVSLHPDDYV